MSITIAVPEQKRADELRQEYVESKKTITKRLREVLVALTQDGRPKQEERVAYSLVVQVQYFLDTRQPTETAENIYRELWPTSRDTWSYRQLIGDLTDYEAQYGPAFRASVSAACGHGLLPFTVTFKADYLQLAASRAKKIVDGIIKTFVAKTLDKLLDILVKKPDYQIAVLSHGYDGDALVADLHFKFSDGTEFVAHLILKDNTSALGNPYCQYPMTFHDAVFVKGEPRRKQVSQAEVEEAFGVERWQPPKPPNKRRWQSVKTGSVISTKDGRLGLVTGLKRDEAQVKYVDGQLDSLPGQRIEAIVAQIDGGFCSDGEACVGLRLADGSKDEVTLEFPRSAQIDDMSYGEQHAAARALAFEHWVKTGKISMGDHDVEAN